MNLFEMLFSTELIEEKGNLAYRTKKMKIVYM